VADIGADWRVRVAAHLGITLFGAASEHVKLMDGAGLPVAGNLATLIGLYEGCMLFEGPPDTLIADPQVRHLYLGDNFEA
jgi:hypothetical protein